MDEKLFNIWQSSFFLVSALVYLSNNKASEGFTSRLWVLGFIMQEQNTYNMNICN